MYGRGVFPVDTIFIYQTHAYRFGNQALTTKPPDSISTLWDKVQTEFDFTSVLLLFQEFCITWSLKVAPQHISISVEMFPTV
jgi:hypothetical protein